MERIDKYFSGVAWKYLSAVDAEPCRSHQHELGGLPAAGFKNHLGDPGSETLRFSARFVFLAEEEDKSISVEGVVSWYDARRKQRTRSPEVRLYYNSNAVTEIITEGMFLVVAKVREKDEVLLVFTESGGSEEQQLRWLFGVESESDEFAGKSFDEETERTSWAARWILEELGVDIIELSDSWLEVLLEKFGMIFPKTREFSLFARETIDDIDPVNRPDDTLIRLMDREESLFRLLERKIVEERLSEGFPDVETFISYSLSIQNRRKSRVGYALENHLEYVFGENSVQYSRGAITENKSKPDFLFPGQKEYQDFSYPEENLAMLGAKSTCKDRWRQVLSEAKRIDEKHLITLEPGISSSQTEEMKSQGVQLVVPDAVHETYSVEQQEWLWSLERFLGFVASKQEL